MGCSGAHQANGGWMPCATHREYVANVGTTPPANTDREVGVRGIATLPSGGLTSAPQSGPFGGKAHTEVDWQQLVEFQQMLHGGSGTPMPLVVIRPEGEDEATASNATEAPEAEDDPIPTPGDPSMDLIQLLRGLLADVVTIYFRAQGYHWNVEGQDFSQYHALFAEIYEDIYGSIDPIAENIRKLDAYAPFTLSGFVAARSIEDTKVNPTPADMARDLFAANAQLLKVLDACFAQANDDNQQGIANFLAERIDMHQKWAWQLRSSLK